MILGSRFGIFDLTSEQPFLGERAALPLWERRSFFANRSGRAAKVSARASHQKLSAKFPHLEL